MLETPEKGSRGTANPFPAENKNLGFGTSRPDAGVKRRFRRSADDYVELTVPQFRLALGALSHRAGELVSGAVEYKHPEGPTECRMGESPARPQAAPGTQGAPRPSSFRRGREGARVVVYAHRPTGGCV